MIHACNDLTHAHVPATLDRRGFLKTALAGMGLAAVGLSGFGQIVRAAGGTDAMLLSCMDYRLMDDVVKYMDGRKMKDKYDHVILAGASLGAQTDKYPAWGRTFWDHLGVALELHHIKKVIVMDHRDCGAYKVFLGTDFGKDPKAETEIHAKHLKSLASAIKSKHSSLEVELLLMDLKGKVEKIG